MNTQISKKNAIVILENVMKQQSLLHKVENIAGVVISEYCGGLGCVEVIFNVDFSEMEKKDYDMYFEPYIKMIENEKLDFQDKATKLYKTYSEISKVHSRRELLKAKIPYDDAILLIKNRILDYCLWLNLANAGLVAENYHFGSYGDFIQVIFEIPEWVMKDDLYEAFYLPIEAFEKTHCFMGEVKMQKLESLGEEIYRKIQEEAQRQLTTRTIKTSVETV